MSEGQPTPAPPSETESSSEISEISDGDLAKALREMRDAEKAATQADVKGVEHALKERYGGIDTKDLLNPQPESEESEPETE